MADDRLDDAIAAVVHAVDRIEQATMGMLDEPLPELAPRPALPEPRTPPPPAFSPQSTGFAARPTTALGGLNAQPEAQDSPPHFEAEAAPAPAPVPAPAPRVDPSWSDYEPFFPDDPGPLPFPADQAQADDGAEPFAPGSAEPSAAVHELVGRIVARTQALEDHLEAARELRAEITELVSRLAAAADRDR